MNDEYGFSMQDQMLLREQQQQIDQEKAAEQAAQAEAEAPAQPSQTPEDPSTAKPPEQESEPEQKPEEPQQGGTTPGYSGFMYGGDSANLGEDVSIFANRAAERLGAAGMGLVDFGVNAYNFLMPGDQLDIKRQTQGLLAPYNDKVAQTMREISQFITPELMGLGLVKRGVNGLRVKKGIDLTLGSAGVKAIERLATATGMGIAIQDINLDPYGDLKDKPKEGMNFFGTLKANWPQQWRWLPDGLATKWDNTPDEKRAKNRYEGLVFAGFEPLVSAASRVVLNAYKTWKATRYIPEVESAVKVTEKLNKGNELLTDNLAVDKLIKGSETLNKDLDDYGAYALSKMQELDKPVKGVHTNFDATELGVRSRDPDGVLGAMDDTYRIANNVDTFNGRVGSMFTSAAAKHGLELEQVKKGWLINEIVKEIKDSNGITTMLQSGKKITTQQRSQAVVDMWMGLTDDYADAASIIELTSKMSKTPKIADESVDRAIRTYRDRLLDIEKMKAQALVETSMAGQVADMSYAGAKAFDKANLDQLQDELFDRLKALMLTKSLRNMETEELLADMPALQRWLLQGDEAAAARVGTKERRLKLTREQKIEDRYRRVSQFIDTLDELRTQKPQWMKPLMQMWEATDGRVDSMYKMNQVINNSLGSLNKAIYDPNPEFPQLILQDMQSTLYNSTLNAVKTAQNMIIGTVGGNIDHVFSPFVGSMLSGDFNEAAKHSSALIAQMQHLGAALKVGGERFVQLSKDPDNYQALLKPDYALRNSKLMESLESAADAALVDGNDGIAAAMLQKQQMHALATDPLLRLVPNIGGATDAISQASNTWYNAHRRALEEFFLKRPESSYNQLSRFGKKRFQAMRRKIEREMYDSNGILKDSMARIESAEISLTKDNGFGKAADAFIRRVPIMRPALMFPRMLGATVESQADRTVIPLLSGMGNVFKPANKMSFGEMREALMREGVNVPDHEVLTAYRQRRYMKRGRALIGSAFVTSAFFMAGKDSLRGRGHYDPAVQRARGKEWTQSSYKGSDGKWYSHKALGPLSTLLDLVADTMDNFDTLGESAMENLGMKLAFIFGGMVDDVNLGPALIPFFDILEGKTTSIQRLAANTVNSGMLLSGHRREWSTFLDPQLEEIQKDFGSYMRAQNGWLDAVVPGTGLPKSVNIHGEVIGADISPFDRARNAFSIIKVGKEMTPEQNFLMRAEYPIQAGFEQVDGVKLDGTQQGELSQLVFSDPQWQRSLKRIVQKYKDYDFEGKRKEVVDAGNASVESPISKYYGLHAELDSALNKVKERVKTQMSDYKYIKTVSYWQERNAAAAARGEDPIKTETEIFIESMNP